MSEYAETDILQLY